jgi:hypothetical protein
VSAGTAPSATPRGVWLARSFVATPDDRGRVTYCFLQRVGNDPEGMTDGVTETAVFERIPGSPRSALARMTAVVSDQYDSRCIFGHVIANVLGAELIS